MLIIIFCQDCEPGSIGRHRLCGKHRRERQRRTARARWERYREDPDSMPGYRDSRDRYHHTNEVKRLNRKMSDNCYKVIAGPPAVADFVEIGSLFSFCDIRQGITAGWIPNLTILERNGERFIIQHGKKIKL
jgi:SET domain-containing protein